MTDEAASGTNPPASSSPTAKTGRAWIAGLACVASVGSGLSIGRYVIPSVTDSTRANVAAEEFCALGDGEGASLIQISGWVTAAQRNNGSWDDVISAIDDRCPEWRAQIAAKADALDD